jgi:hypothetical protein
MATAQIISAFDDSGRHNRDLQATVTRLERNRSYKDLSTIILVPSRGLIPARIVVSWMHMMRPPNNKTTEMIMSGMEVGEAYSTAIENILNHPELSQWKYVLCMEEDNSPPGDGLIKLLERMEAHPEFAAIGGLYFTKGEGGCAQIWGDPNDHPLNFRPQKPDPNGGLVECCGTGQGFTLFRLEMFKDPRLRRPWFKTAANLQEGCFTQDLYFWSDARKNGYRCAIDCSVKVGHLDHQAGVMW